MVDGLDVIFVGHAVTATSNLPFNSYTKNSMSCMGMHIFKFFKHMDG